MSTEQYIRGRRKYIRPQGMLWADNPGVLLNGRIYPEGFEVDQNIPQLSNETSYDNFIILSDDNRSPLNIETERIEERKRMVNGRMRSYHIADKIRISTSWSMLPSRSYLEEPNFSSQSGLSPFGFNANGVPQGTPLQYTTDGGAGGVEILEWYEKHKGSFWVYLAYDKRSNFNINKNFRLREWNEVIEMYISDFSYSVEKRSSDFDLWNISVTLEEV